MQIKSWKNHFRSLTALSLFDCFHSGHFTLIFSHLLTNLIYFSIFSLIFTNILILRDRYEFSKVKENIFEFWILSRDYQWRHQIFPQKKSFLNCKNFNRFEKYVKFYPKKMGLLFLIRPSKAEKLKKYICPNKEISTKRRG